MPALVVVFVLVGDTALTRVAKLLRQDAQKVRLGLSLHVSPSASPILSGRVRYLCELAKVEPDEATLTARVEYDIAGAVVRVCGHPSCASGALDRAFELSRLDRDWMRRRRGGPPASLLHDLGKVSAR